MTITKQTSTASPVSPPLALHIRALRQWHGAHGLEQAELAELAGVSRHALYRLENCRELPPTIEAFFAVAYALGISPDALLDPRERARIEAAVAARRERVERDAPYAEQ